MALLKTCIGAIIGRTPLVQSVRFRYHADKIAKGPLLRRYGYNERIIQSGLLPRSKDFTRKLPIPTYRPKDAWSEKRALFGQNDYIDILGDGQLHPTRILYNVPAWLRGFKGNEYQVAIRKRKAYYNFGFNVSKPQVWETVNKRIRYLHKFMNRKTRTFFSNQ